MELKECRHEKEVNTCSFLTQTWLYLVFSPKCLYLSSSSCKWALYTLYIVSIVCSLSQNKVGLLCRDWSCFTCQQTDRIIALYWSPVISGCVIKNSTEFPYLEKEERPRGTLRLWQEFIIAFAPIYIVAAHTHSQKITTTKKKKNSCAIVWMLMCPPWT